MRWRTRTGLEDPKVLPDWLEKRVKKIERALRLHIAKQTDWQPTRVATLKHMKELLAPWKLTEAQMRKVGDHDAADDEEFSKELGADLCKTLKEAAQTQLDEESERDGGGMGASTESGSQAADVSPHGDESGDEDATSPGEHPESPCLHTPSAPACGVIGGTASVHRLHRLHLLCTIAQEGRAEAAEDGSGSK